MEPSSPVPPFSTPDALAPPAEPSVALVAPPQGLIPAFLFKLLGPSYRTSLLGYLVIASTIIPMIPAAPPWLVELARGLAGGAAGLGFVFAKDKSVTGAQVKP